MATAQNNQAFKGFYAPYPSAGYGFWRNFAYYFYSFYFWRNCLEQGAAMTRRAAS